MSARSLPLLVFLASLAGCATTAHAQSTPGNAPGSQTGDTGSAYAGLASVPEANLFTGIAQTSIPIQVPPGRLGLAPVLALSYSSNAGAGAYGHGWSLPIPRVHRSTRRGLPRYDDSDTFVLEMPGAMVDLERVPGKASAYRAEIESAFMRIGFDRSANRWKVIDKLGVSFTFGSTSASRSGRAADLDGTFAWQLDRVEDPAGNRIDFEYRPAASDGRSSGLPAHIRYGANTRTGQPHFAEVAFEWVPVAHGGRVSWRDGYADPLDVRLASISTHTYGLAARRYDFSFEEDPVTADLRLAGVTLTAFGEVEADDVQLPSTVFLYAAALHEGWPSIRTTDKGAQPYAIPGAGHIRLGVSTVGADNVDLNGDSIVDRIDLSQRPPNVWLGTGRSFDLVGGWNWPMTPSAPRVLRGADGKGRLYRNVFDLDGDSFADIVDSNLEACGALAGYWCIWRGSATGFDSQPTTWKTPSALLRDTEDDGAKVVVDLIDFDADGRLDLVDARSHDSNAPVPAWKIYRNTGDGFESVATTFAAPFPWLSRAKGGRTTHGLVDLNADSLPDFVWADPADLDYAYWVHFPYWEVWFNDGRGFAAQPTQWNIDGGVGDGIGLPNFLSLRAEDGTTIADMFDITGDGRPDLVRRTRGFEPGYSGVLGICDPASWCSYPDVSDSAVSNGQCCFNLLLFVNTGSSFSQPVGWSSPAHGLRADFEYCPYDQTFSSCSIGYLYDFDFFDVDGDGLVDFVERFTGGGKPYDWMVHPHPASATGGRARPNVLIAMKNGVGGETMLRYRAAAGTPETRLPFAHWTVSERELVDSVYDQAPLRTSYAYRGGAFDTQRREMRGFRVVQETDAAGNLRVREYHQDRRLAGRLRRTTNLAAPACTATDPDNPNDPCSPWQSPLGVTEYEWPSSGAVLLASETDVPFHAGTSVENLRRTTRYSYDAFGNVVQRRVESPMAATATTTTEFEYRISDRPGGVPGTFLVSKPKHVRVDEAGRTSPLVEKTFEYEWEAPMGALLAASTCIAWEQRTCVRWSRRSFEYEANGNSIAARAPDGATSRTTYDAAFHFAATSVDPVGLVTTSVTDPRNGLVTETITPGGSRLKARFDGLGRLTRSWGPGTTRVDPLRRIDYSPGRLGTSPPRVVVHEAEGASQGTFFDGLGRTVATKKESRNGDTPVSLVSGLRRYDERGLVVAEVLPFESTDLDVDRLSESFEDAEAWLEYGHDAAARLTTTRAPDGATTVVDRSAPGILRTQDANVTGGEHAGTVTLEFFDGLGRRVLRDACDGAPPAAKPYDCRDGTLLRRESWIYDGLGRVVESRTHGLGIAAGDSVTRIERDGLGNRSTVFHSNAGEWRFVHDDNGRQIEVHKPDGTVLETSYDEAGRIRDRRGPSSRARYTYHQDGDGIGKLRKMTTRAGQMRFSETSSYDERGRIVERARKVAVRRSDPARILVRYRYDELDRRVGTSIDGWSPERAEVVTNFGELGRESSVSTGEHTYVAAATYDAEERLRRIDLGNGLSDLVSYDERDNDPGASGHMRCLRTAHTAAAGGGACAVRPGDLQSVRYRDYDQMGRLLSLDDTHHALDDPRHASRVYEYDALGRLASAGTPAGSAETYEFDPLGNVVRKGTFVLDHHDAEHPSRITDAHLTEDLTLAFEYDVDGRRTSDGEKRFVYDDQDRLVEVWYGDELLSSFGYSDTGERVFSKDSGGMEIELGDGIRVRGGRMERTIVFGGRPVAVERYFTAGSGKLRPRELSAPDVVFLHADHQQSVTLVSDAGGRPVEYRRYWAFGEDAGTFDRNGTAIDGGETRYAYTGHAENRDAALLFLGARHYDPSTASFLTLDPGMQFASPYAYSDGNPISGRDPDGKLWQLTAMEILTLAVGTATFVDSVVRTGDLGHSLTAGVFAGFSVYVSNQLSTAIARPFAGSGHTWLQTAVSVSSAGLQTLEAVEAIDDGRYAGGVVAAGMLAASLIGIESALDPGSGTTPGETQERHGIKDRGMINGRRVIDVDGICATRPGCITNTLLALQENFRVLFTGSAACVGGCQHIADLTNSSLRSNENVLLRCNSFGSIKCLGAIQKHGLASALEQTAPNGAPRLAVEMSGTPLLRPPVFRNVTYQVNLFDPVAWAGTAWSVPINSDVVLGKNWWVPAPLIVHHTRMYEKPFREAFVDMMP